MINIKNNTMDKIISYENMMNLGAGAKVLNSELFGWSNINEGACINRCIISKYFNVGLFSYLADVKVGSYCTFGSRVSVGAANHPLDWLSIHEFQYQDTSQVYGESLSHGVCEKLTERHTTIGSDVWIGDNAVVLKGVTINDGAVIGAGCVVTKDVLPYSIVVGNPAKHLRFRFEDHIIKKLLALRWWDLEMQELNGIDFKNIVRAIEQIQEYKKQK